MIEVIFPLIIIFLLSLLMALYSMRDLDFAVEIRNIIHRRKTRGAIVFFDEGIKHYHHSSSSSKSE